MAISKSAISAALKSVLNANMNQTDRDAALTAFCDEVANQIATAAQSAVQGATYTNIPVLTSPAGPVTGTITTTATTVVTP